MDDPARLLQLKASAGAGKTYALTGRFLELLAGADADDDAPPACARAAAPRHGWPEIMAVTFTNKAAAEMKERVVGRLKARALGLDGARPEGSRDEAALWLARILRRYDQLNIRTIDSLLHLIMRLFALEAGLAPDFQALFSLGDIFDELLDPVVAAAQEHDGPQRRLLAAALDSMLHLEGRAGFQLGGRFRERLGEVLAWRVRNDAPGETDPRRIQAEIDALRADLVRAARAVRPLLDGLKANANFVKLLDKCAGLASRDKLPAGTYATKPGVDDCLNAASRGRGSAALEAAYAALRAAYEACAAQEPILRGARDMAALVALADLMLDVLDGLRATRNVLPAARCEALAAAMLAGCGAPDAFCRMGARLRHMLVDEFQDTSRAQWNALAPLAGECLSKGGSVLLVGDVKQAIYGWRGGDARLFDEAPVQPELAAMAQPRSATLPHNWRSRPVVVDFNNRVFTRLEKPETAEPIASAMLPKGLAGAGEALTGAMTDAFAGCVQTLPPNRQDRTDANDGFVRLVRVEPGDENKQVLIESVREHLRLLFAELRTRRTPGEVAVLVRDHGEAALTAGWLLDWGLPVITENSLALGAHPLVRQLVAWLRFLDYPLNDLALWEFVSGEEIFLPCAGISRAELTDWLAGQDHGGLYRRLRQDWPGMAERFLTRAVRKAGFMTPYDAVSEAVRDLRVLERHPDGAPYVRRFMEVVHRAEQDGHQSLAAFLDFWDAGASAEKVPLPESVDAVRIMTIHQAKGLEFPVVVVPFHHWRFAPGGEPTPVDCRGLRLLAPLCPEMGAAYHEHAARTLLEQLDLLYVAWTRAEQELYCLLTATRQYRGKSPLVRALDVLTEQFPWAPGPDGWPTCEFGTRPGAPTPVPPEPEAPAGSPPACAPAPEADPEPPMAWLPRLKIHRHFSQDVPREALFGGGPVFDARARGTLVHDALDRLRRPGGLDPERAARAAVAVHADILPPGEAAREAVAAEVRGILDWVLALPEFPGWARRGHPECPILTPEGLERRPDLLVTDPDETVVVEYKTGQPSADHERQVREYMALLAGMDGLAPAMRAVILYLDLKTVREVRP